jgi:drug/metabolite transporter (DMT)-like permease
MAHDATRRRVSGLGLAVLSASSFGLAGSLARGLLDAGWSAAAAVCARVLLAAAVLVPVAAVQLRGRWRLVRRNLPLITAYGLVAVAGTQLAYFNAVATLPVGVALLIEYTAPVLVVGWLWVRHGQRPGWLTAGGAALGAAGLVLVLDLLSGAEFDAVGTGWALAAMAGAACYFVLSGKDDTGLPATALAAGGLLIGGIILLLAGLVGIVPLAASARSVEFSGFGTPWWAAVLVLGLVAAALAYVAGIAATRRLGSRLASFVALFEVLAALGFAWLLLAQRPGALQAVGGVLVLAGVVVVNLGESGTAPAEAVPAEAVPAGGSGGEVVDLGPQPAELGAHVGARVDQPDLGVDHR